LPGGGWPPPNPDSDAEDVGLTKVVPFLVGDMLKANGSNYEKGDDRAFFVVPDGKLVTARNPASSEEAAHKRRGLL
jgi:putative intracellular protease/amidase